MGFVCAVVLLLAFEALLSLLYRATMQALVILSSWLWNTSESSHHLEYRLFFVDVVHPELLEGQLSFSISFQLRHG